MKIWAMYKTFRGEEFAIASLKSIYPQVSGVLYVHEDKGWTGREGNTVREDVKLFPDPDQKIFHIDIESATQDEQYEAGVQWLLKRGEDFDYLMLIDTDEVWEDKYWTIANRYLESNLIIETIVPAFRCKMYEYIKSPFYRIEPQSPLNPVVFLHSSMVQVGKIRCRAAHVKTSIVMNDVVFHHYCSVRKNLTEVWAKHIASCQIEDEPMVGKEEWIKEVWNRLPVSKNLLPLDRYKSHWQGVSVIREIEIPEAMRENAIVNAWLKYPVCTRIDPPIKPEYLIIAGLPADFGPSHPEWSTPSKRNKYELARQGKITVKKEDARQPTTVDPVPIQTPVILSPSQKNKLFDYRRDLTGKLAITTIVSGAYQWYVPLFMNRIGKEYPDIAVIVYLRGENQLPHPWSEMVFPIVNDTYKTDGKTTATLRFVYDDNILHQYDYVLITDADMLIAKEDPDIINQHVNSMRKHDLKCYDNYISTWDNDRMRVPGVHFVTRDWWEKTKHARAIYAEELIANGATEWDEITLGRIIEESSLPFPPYEQHIWSHHGLHLGTWRIVLKHKWENYRPDAAQSLYIKKLLLDHEFLEIVNLCSPHLPLLKETFDAFKNL